MQTLAQQPTEAILKQSNLECHTHAGHHLIEEGKRLQTEGAELLDEAKHLHEEGEKLVEEGKRLEAEGHRIEKEHCEELEKKLFIFVNRMRFGKDKGVHNPMSVDEIAGLVGLTSQTAIVRRLADGGDDASDPLEGMQKIKAGDQFIVTRRHVNGGFEERVHSELNLLGESSQTTEYCDGFVIYKDLPARLSGFLKTDVIVQVPQGYPSAMIDRAGLPADSPLIGRVKGSPQEVINVGGRSWRMISYHPHNGGGGIPWDLNSHGFHTYLSEVIAWLEVL